MKRKLNVYVLQQLAKEAHYKVANRSDAKYTDTTGTIQEEEEMKKRKRIIVHDLCDLFSLSAQPQSFLSLYFYFGEVFFSPCLAI